MGDFASLERRLGLKKFLGSRLGTLYFVPYTPVGQRVIVRRFDAELPPELTAAYAELVSAVQRWVEQHPEVDALARIVEPINVGDDYLMRPHHTYGVSTDRYQDEEDPIEPPVQWHQLIAAVRAVPRSVEGRDGVVDGVIRRTLTEPNGKVYFNEIEGRFVVVDPKISADDVRHWAAG
jgi:hypothetical protein